VGYAGGIDIKQKLLNLEKNWNILDKHTQVMISYIST
jgi:hypothetical protein